MSEKDGTERPEPIVYVGPPVTTVGADPNEEQTRAVGFGNPWQCEAFLNHQSRFGWRLTSVSGGPPWRRDSWLTIARPASASTDGLGSDGQPITRVIYRVIGKRQDGIDRGEQARIDRLVEAGWRVVAVLKVEPWNTRPVTFLEHDDIDVIEIVREGDAPEKRQMALAKIRAGGGYDIEVVDVDEVEQQRQEADEG